MAKLILIIFLVSAYAFEESAIFEKDDIVKTALPVPETDPKKQSGITYPGTKWCGPGDRASNYSVLGTAIEADKCCRDHDHCDVIIKAKQTLHGLHNNDMFPVMQCKCEQKFLNCLQKASTTTARIIGRTYFRFRQKCVDYGYPIVNCSKYQPGHLMKRCVTYTVDSSLPKKWQLYEIPYFT